MTKKDAAAPEEKKQQPQQEAPAPNPADGPFDGIDVSKHQGVINWETLRKNPKIKYVYIKATEGSNLVDENYRTNIQNARKAGFKVVLDPVNSVGAIIMPRLLKKLGVECICLNGEVTGGGMIYDDGAGGGWAGSSTVTCPNCGMEVQSAYEYCPYCNYHLW